MEFFDNFSLREMVIGTAVILGIYAGIVIMRLSRLSRPRADEATWKKDPGEFAATVMHGGIEAELAELRAELAGLRDRVGLLEAARHVSPQYEEAVDLAQKGLAARQIAERCDISVAEAEMVCALSRTRPT